MLGFIKRLFGLGIDLNAIAQSGAIILDVRSKREFAGGHGKNSRNIPLDTIASSINEIQEWNKPIITCCASGIRSGAAARLLRTKGIEAYNGGSWQKTNQLYKN